ncbi:MAG: hypothetical protein ABR564_03480, partial [Candidatus Dormibacteria bacterium]
SELGRHQEALDAYSEAVRLNPLNPIALKNTRRLRALLEAPVEAGGAGRAIDVHLFAEEPGRSALTMLIPPRQAVVAAMAPGDAVELVVDGQSLVARTDPGVVLGTVEAKLSRRLLPLIGTGNRYTAAVAWVEDRRIEIMIREAHQSPENSRKSSFPISRAARAADFRPYAKESLLAARELGSVVELEEDVPAPAVDGDDEEPLGVRGLDADLEDATALEEEDDKDLDEDVRPEDEY